MGIKDLLKELRSITVTRHLSEYKGCRVGVDVMCWMHQGIHRCITKLIQGEETDEYVRYIMEFIKLLTDYGLKPLIVLDGKKLLAKRERNMERKADRDESKILAQEALGRGEYELAHSLFKKSIGVTSKMISKVLVELKKQRVEYIVAPYEADAQLAYLSINRLVDLVITQDSDAIVYGCSKTLFKLNKETATGDEIMRRNMGDAKGCDGRRLYANWTDDQFKLFACLAGSDYQSKLPNMGIKTAYKFAKDNKTYDGICQALRQSRFKQDATEEYLVGLKEAWLTFKHQLVYDQRDKCLRHLTPVASEMMHEVNASFLGNFR